MPDAVAATHTWTATAPSYWTLGPLPPTGTVQDLAVYLSTTQNARLTISPVLATAPTADAASHAAGQRLWERGNLTLNTRPAYVIMTSAADHATLIVPIWRTLSGTARWIHLATRGDQALATYYALAIATILTVAETAARRGPPIPMPVIVAPPPLPRGAPGISAAPSPST